MPFLSCIISFEVAYLQITIRPHFKDRFYALITLKHGQREFSKIFVAQHAIRKYSLELDPKWQSNNLNHGFKNCWYRKVQLKLYNANMKLTPIRVPVYKNPVFLNALAILVCARVYQCVLMVQYRPYQCVVIVFHFSLKLPVTICTNMGCCIEYCSNCTILFQ